MKREHRTAAHSQNPHAVEDHNKVEVKPLFIPFVFFFKSDIFFNNFQTDQRFRGNVTNADLDQLTSCTRAVKHKRERSEEVIPNVWKFEQGQKTQSFETQQGNQSFEVKEKVNEKRQSLIRIIPG